MILKGEKVVLRPVEMEDAELLRSMINDPDIESMVSGYSFPISRCAQKEWMNNLEKNQNVFRAIIDINNSAIGEAILTDIDMKNGTAEIHIKIAGEDNRRKGYGFDSITTLTNYAFNELRLNCIFCLISERNIASKKMFEKCGYIYEGRLKKRIYKKGQYYDLLSFSVTNKE